MFQLMIFPHYIPAQKSYTGNEVNWQVRVAENAQVCFVYANTLAEIKRDVDEWTQPHPYQIELIIDDITTQIVTEEDWAIAILTYT